MADSTMHALAASAAGFLLSVLWFDLMFDVQVLAHRGGGLPRNVIDSIASYYRRVTTDSRPMNRMVAAAMVTLVVAISVQLGRGVHRMWAWWLSLALAVAPILLAGLRTVPAAVRLGSQADALDRQADLARSICRDHIACLALILGLLVIQLTVA